MAKSSMSRIAGTVFLAVSLGSGCLIGVCGCSNGVGAESSNKNDNVALARDTTRLDDRKGVFSPRVEKDYSIPYKVTLEGATYLDENGNLQQASGAEYTVDVPIDPYQILWSASGTITDIDHRCNLAVIRLTSSTEGHFPTQDVLITFDDYLDSTESDLNIGTSISFQYLLTDPVHTPLQVYNVTLD